MVADRRRSRREDAPNVVVIAARRHRLRPASAATAPRSTTPTIDRLAAQRPALHQLPRHAAVLADARVAAHRPQPPQRRHGVRSPTADTGFPDIARPHHATRPRRVAEVLRDERLRHVRASASGTSRRWSRRVGRRPVRPVAARPRLRPLLRLPRGRDRPVPPRPRARQPPRRPAADAGATATTSPRTWSTTRSGSSRDQVSAAARQAVLPLPRVRRDALPAPGAAGVPRQVPRPLRRGLGRDPRAAARAPARARHRARRAPSSRRATPASSRGTTSRPTSRSVSARLQEAFAAFLDHTDAQIGRLVDVPRAARPARQHDLSSCCPTTAPARRAGRSACMHEMKFFNGIQPDARRGDLDAPRRRSAGRTATPTTRGAGPRPATRRSSGTSRTPTRAACTCR